MGLFDTINFQCPNCGRMIQAQSKSGNCDLKEYDVTSVPLSVSSDANRHSPYWCECGKKWYLTLEGTVPEEVRVCLTVKEYVEDPDEVKESVESGG